MPTLPMRPASPARRSAARPGFTLTEMLVVIGIIALLIGILLPALSRVQERARKTQTENLMQEFQKACEVFQQQFGFYPGIVPEAILAADPKISGTENAILHLCGGAIPQDDPAYNAAPYNSWTEIVFNGGATYGTFAIRVNPAKVGEGPRVRGVQYKSFFSPKSDDLLAAPGQYGGANADDPFADDPYRLPDLLDSWGTPILYMRQMRPQGSTLVAGALPADSMADCIFAYQPLQPYLVSSGLGELGQDQANSVLRAATLAQQNATLAQIIRNPAYGQASQPLTSSPRGAIVILSAGKDGIFFGRNDGPGSQTSPVVNIVTLPAGPYAVNEYDDIRVFGGA
jgi:prepilin-type N-terminal cleavage/methylation domain-containing protein